MKADPFPYMLLSIIVILILSIGAQAAEYREVNAEVNASNISKHIENSDDIYLDNCHIFGELNANKMKLETVPNPNLDRFLPLGWIANYPNENLNVIKSNITIRNSIFENITDFSSVYFSNSTEFGNTTFNNRIQFSYTIFNKDAVFSAANFNKEAIFSDTTFNELAVFSYATFNEPAGFSDLTFNEKAFFHNTTFNKEVIFLFATFNKNTDFSSTTFNDEAHCFIMNFNKEADFWPPESSENIFTDGKTCVFLMKSYNEGSRYIDANNIYFNYRKLYQEDKDLTDPSKWFDFISMITCGYGTRISYTLGFSAGIILFFAMLYRQSTTVSINSKNIRVPVKVYWEEPKIYRLSDTTEKKSIISFWDALYFSIMIFTTLGSEWNPRGNYRKWVALEGILGYIMLGIFLATLLNTLVKPMI